jgi:hypothetical protein
MTKSGRLHRTGRVNRKTASLKGIFSGKKTNLRGIFAGKKKRR